MNRFPAKRHNEPDGLHRQRVTIVPGFQQEIMRMLSNSLLFFNNLILPCGAEKRKRR